MMTFDAIAELRKQTNRPYLSTARENNAWWVRFLCRCLIARDYTALVSDTYDSELARLVKMYQSEHGLYPDGVVGPKTWAMLANEEAPAGPLPTPDDADGRKVRAMIVTVARTIEGRNVRETPGKPNSGPSVEWLLEHADGKAGQPWCMAFAYNVVDLAYAILDMRPPAGLPPLSTSALVRWATADGSLEKKAINARPGDLYVLSGGTTGYKHVGVIVAVEGTPGQADFRLVLVEGNTNEAGSPEGDGVYTKYRSPARYPGVVVKMG